MPKFYFIFGAQEPNRMTITNIKVKLIGKDGNVFAILGTVIRAMEKNKVPQDTIKEYRREAMLDDYDNLLRVTMKYVEVI